MDHSGHKVVIVAEDVTVQIATKITDMGDVELSDELELTDWNNSSSHIYCQTCKSVVQAGEDGLAEDWQML